MRGSCRLPSLGFSCLSSVLSQLKLPPLHAALGWIPTPTGRHVSCLDHSPEGLNEVEVGKLVAVHKGL